MNLLDYFAAPSLFTFLFPKLNTSGSFLYLFVESRDEKTYECSCLSCGNIENKQISQKAYFTFDGE